jgi:hypothetical protein
MHNGQHRDWLVEFRICGDALGYFAVSLAHSKLVIRTFLFRTMDGTPEGKLLRQNLRLARSDKEYLGLDQLETFALSDIQNDPKLVALLEQCGCGHLLRIVRPGAVQEYLAGYARDFRKHLGLVDRC